MTKEHFIDYWNRTYPNSLPIGHELKHVFNSRWFRIHSLPESKRYADSPEEETILLNRQNVLIGDIFGEGQEFFILVGLYTNDLTTEQYLDELDWEYFEHLYDIPLHKERPEEYEDDPTFYQIFISKVVWRTNQHDELLLKIANDEVRASFICLKNNRIINPYDGGVDIILENETLMQAYKKRFSNWLSTREDGM
ncbi:MAG: hypothetical protein RLO12_03745 [Fulvivirga sp.]